MVFPRFPTASRLIREPLSEKELLKSEDARRTKPPPPVERLSTRLRDLSPLLLVVEDDRKTERQEDEGGNEREKTATLSLSLSQLRRDK